MKKTIFLISIVTLCFILSCQDNVPIEMPDPDPIDTLEYGYHLFWEIPLRKDSISDAGILNVLKGNELYYSRTPEGLPFLPLDDELICLDKDTGEEMWSWYDENNRAFSQPVVNENIISIENANSYYILDRLTGEILFQGYEPEGDLRTLTESGLNSLIANIQYGNSPTSYKNKIVEISKETGQLDTILVREKDDDFNHYLYHPQLILNENNDTILLYFYNRIIWNPAEIHGDFIKYNLSLDSLEWMLSDFSFTPGPGTVTAPIIIDDKIYVHTTRSIFCFNFQTGEEIWRQEYIHTNFTFTNFIINNNILNTISDEGHLIGIDIVTGEELYYNDYSALSKGLTYFEEKLFYVSEFIFIVDHKTGELLHKLETKNFLRGDIFRNKIAIDEDNRVMFVQDDSFMQAIKIPD